MAPLPFFYFHFKWCTVDCSFYFVAILFFSHCCTSAGGTRSLRISGSGGSSLRFNGSNRKEDDLEVGHASREPLAATKGAVLYRRMWLGAMYDVFRCVLIHRRFALHPSIPIHIDLANPHD